MQQSMLILDWNIVILTSGVIIFRVYADESFSSNDDLSSQLWFIVILCDDRNQCNVLDFVSRESKHAVFSIMGVKVDVFTDVFETFATIAVDLSPVFGKNIPFRMFTHSNQVFYIMTRGKLPMEKLLSIDIAAAREAY